MTPRTLVDRLLSPAGFALALLLFLLPFVSVSCSAPDTPDETVTATFAGIDLVTGGTPTFVTSDGTRQEVADDGAAAELDALLGDFYPAQPLAILAFVLILAGMVAGLALQHRRRALVNGALALFAVVLLTIEVIVVAPQKAADVRIAGMVENPNMHTTPAYGFWLTIIVLIALTIWQAYVAPRSPRLLPWSPGDPGGPSESPGPSPGDGSYSQ
jgi:hypothetical protein